MSKNTKSPKSAIQLPFINEKNGSQIVLHREGETEFGYEIVWAFPTSPEVQQEHGIFLNFSMTTFIKVGSEQLNVNSLNGLTMSQNSTDQSWYISSINKTYDRRVVGRDGSPYTKTERIISVTMLPKHKEQGKVDEYERLVDLVLQAVRNFITKKKAEKEERQESHNGQFVANDRMREILKAAGLDPDAKPAKENQEPVTSGKVPF